MRKTKKDKNDFVKQGVSGSETGAALVVAIMVMLLLAAFVTLVVSRVTTETVITATDSSENKAVAATMASLESTTRDFADVFERKLTPTAADIDAVRTMPIPIPQLESDYTFTKLINQTRDSEAAEITGGIYSGLYALRDEYEVDITAKDNSTGVETQIKRRFLNDRIPLFQFGIFFEDDLELNRPPLFTFGGRVHTNQNFFVSAYPVSSGGGIYFKSKATAHGELVNDIWKTRSSLSNGTDNQNGVFVADAGGVFRQLNTGKASVNCASPSGPNVFAYNPQLPVCSRRSQWASEKTVFQGNLDTNTPRLDLPLYRLNINLVELIKRPKLVGDLHSFGNAVVPVTAANQDSGVVSRERFANKEGIRISLADSRDRLPGCANVPIATPCGIRLDGPLVNGTGGTSIGYQPLPMQDGYQATALNGTRMVESWIKVEMVAFDYNNARPITTDITEDFLSLGVTERAPIKSSGSNLFQINGYGLETLPDTSPQKDDARSIIKLQRFTIPGVAIPNANSTPGNADFNLSSKTIGSTNHNLVIRYINPAALIATNPSNGCSTSPGPNYCGVSTNRWTPTFPAAPPAAYSESSEDNFHLKSVRYASTGAYINTIVPFPIQMFDTREGIPTDNTSHTNTFNANVVPNAGVMSMVDIDVENLKRFYNGSYNDLFPTTTPYAVSKGAGQSLKNSDIPTNKGWVLFISDRRGDRDFDGEYDMEDVFPDNILQYNEDVNENSTLERKFYPATNWEAPTYTTSVNRSRAATTDHGYFRRGVRLINGISLPGIYDVAKPNQSQGFTVASENGVYVLGNYNATGVTLSGGSLPAPSQNYLPQNTVEQVPAAVISDAVTILSNNWDDAKSFRYPFTQGDRLATATQVRFALLTGDGITGNTSISYNPSQFGQLNGGIHNFKRFLERWTDVRLNYAGSLVNLFTSRNNNGFWKCCNAVYNPPIRDWTFDTTFLDPNRLPPGTPYIYSMTFTGFKRVND